MHDPLPASHVLVQLEITLQHLRDWNKRMIVMGCTFHQRADWMVIHTFDLYYQRVCAT